MSSTHAAHTSIPFALVLTALSGSVDSYAIMTHRVMTNAQTGNVVMMAQAVALGHWGQVGTHLWSMLAFMAGSWIANFVPQRSHPVDATTTRLSPRAHPLVWMTAIFAAVFATVGLIPAAAPAWLSVVPLAIVGGMLFTMFRDVAGMTYIPVTTTGNLVRVVTDLHKAVYAKGSERESSRRALAVHGSIVSAFIAGAVLGGLATHWIGLHGIWVAALGMAVAATLLGMGRDERA